MKTRFMAERRFFDLLRSDCSTEARQEYELGIATVIERYNPTIHENRFVAGGAAEFFTWALLRSVDIDCAYDAKSGAILLPENGRLSIKSSFRGPTNVRLINQMGRGKREWKTATLFVISGEGIVYGDPDMVADTHIQPTGDGVTLKRAALRAFIADSENVFPMEIAAKPPADQDGLNHKVSSLVAHGILQEMGSDVLSRAVGPLPSPAPPAPAAATAPAPDAPESPTCRGC